MIVAGIQRLPGARKSFLSFMDGELALAATLGTVFVFGQTMGFSVFTEILMKELQLSGPIECGLLSGDCAQWCDAAHGRAMDGSLGRAQNECCGYCVVFFSSFCFWMRWST